MNDNVVQIPERPQGKSDPLREIFRKPLGKLTSEEIRTGVGLLEARLKAMDGALKDLEVRVKRDVLGALGADSDEGVQRLKRELADHRSARDVMALALESAREQYLVARKRERSTEFAAKRAEIERLLAERSALGVKAQQAADALIEALQGCWRLAQDAQRRLGTRVPPATIAALRPEATQHVTMMYLCTCSPQVWPYNKMPLSVHPASLATLIANDNSQLLIDLDEAVDHHLQRAALEDVDTLDAPTGKGEAPPEPEAA